MTSPPNRLLQERRLGGGLLVWFWWGSALQQFCPWFSFAALWLEASGAARFFTNQSVMGGNVTFFPSHGWMLVVWSVSMCVELFLGDWIGELMWLRGSIEQSGHWIHYILVRVALRTTLQPLLLTCRWISGWLLRESLMRWSTWGLPPMHVTQDPLKALRVAASAYYEPEVGIGDVVPLQFSQLSLPSVGTAGVDLVSAVDESIRDVVVDFENRMLQDEDTWTCISRDAAHLKPYSDPSLHDRSKYLEFLRLLFDRGILSFSRHCRGRAGAFTVSKKDKIVDGAVKKRQRLVLDCRQTNLLFKPSPHTELGSLASLAELTLQPSQQLYISGADIQDCFYAVHIPETMMRYFCLEFDISSEEVRTVTGGSFSDVGGPISPCINVLPMGFSWSFFLVQHIYQSAVLRSLSISEQDLFLDGRPPPHISSSGIYSMPYCDNIHSISSDKSSCNEGKQRIVSELAGQGFTIHEEEDASTLFNTLGGVVDGDSGRVGMTSRRAWDLIHAFEYVAEHVVSREVVQKLLGHAMFFSTINRGGMSVFRRLYDFVEHCKVPRRLTSQERQECLVFAGLIPLLFADLRKQWSNTLFCTDASPDGYGVCCREVERSTAESLGRWNERWRFKRLGPEEWAPRRRALGRDPFVDGITVVGDDGEYDSIEQVGLNEDFPEVPLDVVDSSHWRTVLMGKWQQKEAITVKEGRALVLCLRRLCRSSRSRGLKHVILVDSFSLALAVHKGRARSFDILRIIQQVAALTIAGGFSVRLRWIASEQNVADGPSRGQIEPGPYRPGDRETVKTECEEDSVESGEGDCSTFKAGGEKAPIQPIQIQKLEGGNSFDEVSSSSSSEGWSDSCVVGGRGGLKGAKRETHCSGGAVSVSRSAVTISGLLREVREFLPGQQVGLATKENDVSTFQIDAFSRSQIRVVIHHEFQRHEAFSPSTKDHRHSGGNHPWQRQSASELVSLSSTPARLSCNETMSPSGVDWKTLLQLPLFLLLQRNGSLRTSCPRNRQVRNGGKQYRWFAIVVRDSQDHKPDKTGVFDNSVPLNSVGREYLGQLLWERVLVLNAKDEKVYPFDVAEFRKNFQEAGLLLGFKNLHPYQSRHGGASEDLNSG